MKKPKRNFLLVIVLLLFVSVKSDADDESQSVHDEGAIKGCDSNSGEVTVKVLGTKSDESECPCVSSDGKNENSKLEKPNQVASSNSDDKIQISKSQDTKGSQQVADLKQANGNANECNQQSGSQAAKSEELKLEDTDNLPVAVDGSKQQKSKEDDKNQKTNLHDVNSQVENSEHAKSKKRETYSDSPSFAMGLPRDASYFFDDLEPFINNNSDIGRIGRAAPSRQIQVNVLANNGVTNFYIFYLDKNQKSRLNGKGKEIIEEDVDEDEEEEKNEEDDKQDEDDYDDEEDMDSDCKPSTSCPTTPKCPTTTRCPTTTTPCPPPTTKCTTKHQCPTTCKTTPQCTTSKCPKLCGKGGGTRIQLGARVTTEGAIKWDADKKKISNKKRKVHSKVAPSTE